MTIEVALGLWLALTAAAIPSALYLLIVLARPRHGRLLRGGKVVRL